MDKTLQGLNAERPRLFIKGISSWVLSAFGAKDPNNKELRLPERLSLASLESCQQSLLSIIESQIIPKLTGTRHDQPPIVHEARSHSQTFNDGELQRFSKMCISDQPDEALQHVKHLMAQGLSLNSVYLDLITPAARWLGQQWTQDQIDFTVVTHGLMRMHQITRHLSDMNSESASPVGEVKRIFLACAPGSMHVLGLTIVAEFFRNHGWHVVIDISPTEHSLVQSLKREWFDMIGLSVGLVEQLPDIPALIERLKKQALNPSILVILGGAATILSNHITHIEGADGIATRADEAVELANRLIQTR